MKRKPPEPTLADLIRHERERLGWTQAEAARRLGMHRNSYIQWEGAGDRRANLTVDSLRKLHEAGFELPRIVPDLFH